MNSKETYEVIRAICVEGLSVSEAAMALKKSEAKIEQILLKLEESGTIPRGKLWSLLGGPQTKIFGK